MKHYIKSNTNQLEIAVELVYEIDDEITCAINMADAGDIELDELLKVEAFEDIDMLMDLARQKLLISGYDIIEGPTHSSNENSNSFYMTICRKGEFDELAVTIILYVRVSDHRLSNREYRSGTNRFDVRAEYYKKHTLDLREINVDPDTELLAAFKEIIIGNQKYPNIVSAVNHICNVVKDAL